LVDITPRIPAWFWLIAVAYPLVLLFVVLVAVAWKGHTADED
jgi:hypothetical protein